MLVPLGGAAASLTRNSDDGGDVLRRVMPARRWGAAARRSISVSTAPGLSETQRTACSPPSRTTRLGQRDQSGLGDVVGGQPGELLDTGDSRQRGHVHDHPPLAAMRVKASRHPAKAASGLTAITCRHCASVMSARAGASAWRRCSPRHAARPADPLPAAMPTAAPRLGEIRDVNPHAPGSPPRSRRARTRCATLPRRCASKPVAGPPPCRCRGRPQ